MAGIALIASIPLSAAAAPLTPSSVPDNVHERYRFGIDKGPSVSTSYRQKAKYNLGHIEDYDAVWGVEINDLLPLPRVKTAGEYAVSSFDPQSGDGLGDHENHMFRLRLESPGSRLSWGGHVYSVGEAFAADVLGGELLSREGLPNAGDGTDSWARWRTPLGLTLKPQLTRRRSPAGDSTEQLSLAMNHALTNQAHVHYRLASTQTAFHLNGNGGTRQHSAHLGVALPRVNINLDLQEFSREFGDGTSNQRYRTALLGRVRINPWLQMTPSLSHEVEHDASDQPLYTQNDAALQIQLDPRVSALPRLNARLAYSDREQHAALEPTRRLDALLGTHFEFRHPDSSTTLHADFTWAEPLTSNTALDGGMGFQFSIRHTPSR